MRRKTSILVEEGLWQRFRVHAIQHRTSVNRLLHLMISRELETGEAARQLEAKTDR